MRFFGLSIAETCVQIDVIADDITDLYALSVNTGSQCLEFDNDLVETAGWNPDGDRRRMAATIGLSRLLDESTNAIND